MSDQRHLDWMYIRLSKLEEKEDMATYRFAVDVYVADMERKPRKKCIGEVSGSLVIDKTTGEVRVVEPVPEDTQQKVFSRAARAIRKHWEDRQYPEHTSFQCG